MSKPKLYGIWKVGIVKECWSLPATTLCNISNRNWNTVSVNTIRKC